MHSAYASIAPLTERSASVFLARVPGSKSYTNRALVLAAQRPGTTRIVGALHSQDTENLARALGAFRGIEVAKTADGFVVERVPGPLGAPSAPLDLGGAGTPARLLIAFAAAVQGTTIITGNARLRERPMHHLLDALASIGVQVRCLERQGCLPVAVTGGRPHSDVWTVDGSVSSQFVTSLLLAAAQQERPIRIHMLGNLVSRPYVEMTLHMMRELGIAVASDDLRELVVEPGTITASTITIEPDASAMSYFLAAAALTGTSVRLAGIGSGSAQGDVGLAHALAAMGCRVSLARDEIVLEGGPLRGIDLDMERMPDTVLTLAVVASQAEGDTRISNIANLRVKECDRIHAAVTELARLGVAVEEGDDWLIVRGRAALAPARIHTYDDHRVAMAFGVLKLLAPDIDIEDPACTAKSFPGFWEELARFRAHHVGVA